MKNIHIYWLRRDFRLRDNPALYAATEESKKENSFFLPIFILEEYMRKAEVEFQFSYSERNIFARLLVNFSKKFEKFLILEGKGAESIYTIAKILEGEHKEINKVTIHVNEDVYTDFYKQIEKLKKLNINVKIYDDAITVNKNIKTGAGNLYSIFTPFKKAVWSEFLNSPVLSTIDTGKVNYLTDDGISALKNKLKNKNSNAKENKNKINILEDTSLVSILSRFDKNRKFKAGESVFDIDELLPDTHIDFDTLEYDEEIVLQRYTKYVRENIKNYNEDRDPLNKEGTSKMSMALAHGLISARQMKEIILDEFITQNKSQLEQQRFKEDLENIWKMHTVSEEYAGVVQYISELIWREFYKYIMLHNKDIMHVEFQAKFRNKIEWLQGEPAKERFRKWIKGETGYKIVDAAMIELAKTGYMHNRARMIVASVLTKNLGIDWRCGQEYFRSILIDLDEASNSGGWQWGASVGSDPKPIRIFNPYLQAENYDKGDVYQKKWLSEERYYFDYPVLVDHKVARVEAMKRYGLGSDSPARDY